MSPAPSAILAEKARREAAAQELHLVLGKVYEARPGAHVRCSEARRVLKMCGLEPKAAEIAVAVQAAFEGATYNRVKTKACPHPRVFAGIRMRPGFSLVKLAAALRRKYDRDFRSLSKLDPDKVDAMRAEARRGEDGSIKQAGIKDARRAQRAVAFLATPGVVADWERELDEVGLSEAQFIKNTEAYNDNLQGLRSLSPELVQEREERGKAAHGIPGFFGKGAGADTARKIWDWYHVKGLTPAQIAPFVEKSPEAVKRIIQRGRKRLERHSRSVAIPAAEQLLEPAVRYLYAHKWASSQERDIWEATVIGLEPRQALSQRLGIAQTEIARVLTLHRKRCGLQIDAIG